MAYQHTDIDNAKLTILTITNEHTVSHFFGVSQNEFVYFAGYFVIAQHFFDFFF
jgi:hypothetical protein